jgi:hypothetical protein
MDRDGDKQLDFEELVLGLSVLLRGTARQKLQLFYAMFLHHDAGELTPALIINL